MSVVSWNGLDPAEVLHALYHGTQPLGPGFVHNLPGLTVEQAREDLHAARTMSRMSDRVSFDYYYGRPLKLEIHFDKCDFDAGLYDHNAGDGAAQRVIDALRARTAEKP